MHTLGDTTRRQVKREESWGIAIGFPISGSNVIADFTANMMVKLNNDGTVSPVAATTDLPLGRLTSTFQDTDAGCVRVEVPFTAHMYAKANGTLDEGQLAACSGFDATNGIPIYKAAASGDWASAIVLVGGATTTINNEVGILRVPIKVA